MDGIHQYIESIQGCQFFTEQEERRLFRKMKRGDQAARELLIRSQLPFVMKLAKKIRCGDASLMDRVQIGNAHLIHIIDNRFDPNRGRLSTLIGCSVSRAIMKAALFHRPVVLPNHSAGVRFPADFKRAQSWQSIPADFDVQMPDNDPAARAEYTDTLRVFRNAIQRLPARERFIVRQRLKGETMKSIGKVIGVSKERVRQLQEHAERKVAKTVLRASQSKGK